MQLLPYDGCMSITLPTGLIDQLPHLTGGAIKTYLALSRLKSTTTPKPTQEDIANHMNACPRSVLTYLKELEREGYIEKRRIGSGRRTDYVLLTSMSYGEK
jgi:DNA-binding MarR family transcriptional regulator